MTESVTASRRITLRCPLCLTLNRMDLAAAGRPVCGSCERPIRSPDVARRFEIQGVPTLIVFREGQPVARQTGALPRPAIEAMLES